MTPEQRAPGWQIRCRKCGFTEPWGKYGIRLAAAGTEYTVGWCAKCRWIRTHAIERAESPTHVREGNDLEPADADATSRRV